MTMNAIGTAIAIFSLFLAARVSDAQTQTTFLIETGSSYTYRLGFISVPDCDLNDDQQCDFAIDGSFTLIESGEEASIVNADLTITSDGTELPMDSLATSDGVEDWLEGRVLELLPTGAPGLSYADSLLPTFFVTVVGSTAMLSGGFDNTFVDGNGIEFTVSAIAIPEPSSLILFLGSVTMTGAIRRSN